MAWQIGYALCGCSWIGVVVAFAYSRAPADGPLLPLSAPPMEEDQ